MRLVFLNLALILSVSVFGQEIEHLEQKWYADRIITRTKDLKPFVVDRTRRYDIKNEGKEYVEGEQKSIISADLTVNKDSLTNIENTEAYLHGDTLDILIYNEIDASHDHNFQIQIIKEKCFIFYDFSYPVDDQDRKVKTLSFNLTLDTREFKKGKEIRGYVEYAGRCTNYCKFNAKDIKVNGDFIVTVK